MGDKKMNKKIKKIIALGTMGLVGSLAILGCTTTYTQEEVDAFKATEFTLGKASVDTEKIRADAVAGVDITTDNADVIADAVKEKQDEIDRLNTVIADAEEEIAKAMKGTKP